MTLQKLLLMKGYSSMSAYYSSSHWKEVSYSWRRSGLPCYCLLCGNQQFRLHHYTHARLGCERLSDLVPLCSKCHQGLHRAHESHPVIPLADFLSAARRFLGRDWKPSIEIEWDQIRQCNRRGAVSPKTPGKERRSRWESARERTGRLQKALESCRYRNTVREMATRDGIDMNFANPLVWCFRDSDGNEFARFDVAHGKVFLIEPLGSDSIYHECDPFAAYVLVKHHFQQRGD